jgi:hypothetical protein
VGVNDTVEGRRRTHGSVGYLLSGVVVASNINGRSLASVKLLDNDFTVGIESISHRFEEFTLNSECIGPVYYKLKELDEKCKLTKS